MPNIRAFFLLISMSCVSIGAAAAGTMKPGLWNVTIKSEAFAKIPKLPPEQLEQMRAMGIEMPQMQGGAMVQKMCLTKEMAANEQVPGLEKDQSGCQSKNSSRIGLNYTMDIVCNGPDVKGSGTLKVTASGDSSYNAIYDFKGVARGQPMNHHQETTANWVSADCGRVKPMTDFTGKK